MKRIMVLYLAVIAFLYGCSGSKNIIFCEGLNTDGEGVNCGIKFETGDLTAIIKSGSAFNSKTIKVEIFEKSGRKDIRIESISVNVNPDEKTVSTTLSFYNEGRYSVKAYNNKNEFADGDIEIVDY